MKKMVSFLVILVSATLITGPFALAFETVQMRIDMYKDVSSTKETYGIQFSVFGDRLKDVARMFVDGPKGRRIQLNNTLDLNEVYLVARNLTYNDFDRWFPEGEYKVFMVPQSFGRLRVVMSHNFPAAPTILFPPDGAGDISPSPVILWNPVTDANSFRLTLKNASGFLMAIDLPVGADSYAVPAGLLNPGALYEMSLESKVTDFAGNGLTTTRFTSFTTKAE